MEIMYASQRLQISHHEDIHRLVKRIVPLGLLGDLSLFGKETLVFVALVLRAA
jgi:hypothetical protein